MKNNMSDKELAELDKEIAEREARLSPEGRETLDLLVKVLGRVRGGERERLIDEIYKKIFDLEGKGDQIPCVGEHETDGVSLTRVTAKIEGRGVEINVNDWNEAIS